MNDLDRRLGDAGARLRDTAPSPATTEAALRSLGDVRLDDERDAGRRRLWIVAPAVLAAAAAAVVGVIVVTRPDQQAVVPADTTIAPAPAPTMQVAPTTTLSTTTTIPAESGVPLANGVRLETSNVDFDGDGGACLTLSSGTEQAHGCATGPQLRSTYGQPLQFRLDGTPYALFPTGVDGGGRPELNSATPSCRPASRPRRGTGHDHRRCRVRR